MRDSSRPRVNPGLFSFKRDLRGTTEAQAIHSVPLDPLTIPTASFDSPRQIRRFDEGIARTTIHQHSIATLANTNGFHDLYRKYPLDYGVSAFDCEAHPSTTTTVWYSSTGCRVYNHPKLEEITFLEYPKHKDVLVAIEILLSSR